MKEYQQTKSKELDKAYFTHENGVTEIDLDYESKDSTREKGPNKIKSSRLIVIAFETQG
jgi:hypothetical protein